MSTQVSVRAFKNGEFLFETRCGVGWDCINVFDAMVRVAQSFQDFACIAGHGRVPHNIDEWDEIEVTFRGVTERRFRRDLFE
jgi:hypothetical protein